MCCDQEPLPKKQQFVTTIQWIRSEEGQAILEASRLQAERITNEIRESTLCDPGVLSQHMTI